MIRIWHDRLRLLRMDHPDSRRRRTGALYRSVVIQSYNADSDAIAFRWQFEFNEYGVYVERGTGKEVFRGNAGDIGRVNRRRTTATGARRKQKIWMSPKYFMSVCNLRDFLAENLSQDCIDIVESAVAGSVSIRI